MAARKPKVIVTRRLPDPVETRMRELFDTELNLDDVPLDREALIKAVQRADAIVPTITDHIDADLIAAAGEKLKLIANFGAGVDHIDVAAANERGIAVTNTPGVLTEDTADTCGVDNRLDAAQSIRAGAEYLNKLRNALPPEVKEPDRLWFALAAYNLGMGHLKAARHIAKTLKTDANSWYEMKKVLPLLAKEQFYKRLKSGRGRGGEAVIMVENIRMYTEILNRHERSSRHPIQADEATTGGLSHPLRNIYEPGFPLFTR